MLRSIWPAAIVLAFGVAWVGCAAAPKPPEAPPPPTSAQAGDTTIVAVAPASECCPKPTLWEFLGVKAVFQGVGRLGRGIVNRLGSRFPGLEPGPPLLAITDPANVASPDPSMEAAAKAKQAEDAAPQKIKAIRYLATLGCAGCYPGVEEALLAKLEDCTEAVRFEAVKALRGNSGNPCEVCKAGACCSPAVLAALDTIANKTDDQGCYVEPSARVRRQARLALAGCGETMAAADLPGEGPGGEPPPADAAANSKPRAFVPFAAEFLAARTGTTETVLARVNGEPVFDTDVMPRVERQVALVAAQMPTGEDVEFRRWLVRRELVRAIDEKLLAQDARRRSRLTEGSTPSVDGGVRHALYTTDVVSEAEAIDPIRKEIAGSQSRLAQQQQVEKLRRQGVIWTIYDEPVSEAP